MGGGEELWEMAMWEGEGGMGDGGWGAFGGCREGVGVVWCGDVGEFATGRHGVFPTRGGWCDGQGVLATR